MSFQDLATPCALVDLDVVERNCQRMRERLTKLGVMLRAHVKTHKCVEAARLQHGGGTGPITVSTLAEARAFGRAGFRDQTYAVPIAPEKIPIAREISREVDVLALVVDHPRHLIALEVDHAATGYRFPVFLKVDCGYHRAGVDPKDPESVVLADRLSRSPAITFRGVVTHAGHSYDARNAEEIRVVAENERRAVADFADRLRAAGVAVPTVSVGSTPTMNHVTDLSGVTEARPGNYVFHDRTQALIGSCRLQDAALTVLVSVIGHHEKHGQLLIDGGALALFKDPGPTHLGHDLGYALVLDLEGRPLQHLDLSHISQEHGQIQRASAADFARFPIGSRLRLLPNHSCLTAALHPTFYIHRAQDLITTWHPIRGW